jgi:Lrp/AsnC family transcriptional regulator, leucine-responsive regulatory protein
MEMDSYDLKILNMVQLDNKQPTEKIASKIGLSASAVQRRLTRLRDSGAIEAEVAIVSPEAVGRKLFAIVEVTMQRERPLSAPQDDFRRLMLTTPEVMQCYHVTGDVDFILIISASDMEDYEAITRRLFVDNPAVRGYTTSIVLKRVKYGLALPLGL